MWAWWVTGVHGVVDKATLGRVFAFFVQASVVVFGSGLAVIPFLHGGVVTSFGWLTERQFLDAVAVSMITPGPVVITVAFIGYLVAGPLGGLVAALGMFLPTYLAVVLVAPWFRRVMAGEDASWRFTTEENRDQDWDGAVADPDVVDEAWSAWRDEVAYAEELIDTSADLGREGRMRDGKPIQLREVLVHMLEEYARHCGHADLLRERIDGRVGQ
jgi:hypothetical protein